MQDNKQIFIGIDGGGTKCKARVEDLNGVLLGEGLAGPANPARNFDLAIQSIMQASKLALQQANLTEADYKQASVVLGLAGVNLPSVKKKMTDWLHPYNNVQITTDLHIACLGAHNGEDGAILITGTGTSGFSNVNGQQLVISGHGFPIGDKGSGAWIGCQVIAMTLESWDEVRPRSMLTEKVNEYFSARTVADIVSQALSYMPVDHAKLVPIFLESLEQGDPNAQLIMQDAVIYLQNLIERLQLTKPPHLSLIGGLSQVYSTYFNQQIQDQITAAISSPEQGAVRLARTLFTQD